MWQILLLTSFQSSYSALTYDLFKGEQNQLNFVVLFRTIVPAVVNIYNLVISSIFFLNELKNLYLISLICEIPTKMNVYRIQKEIHTYIIENIFVVTKNEREGGRDKLGVWD